MATVKLIQNIAGSLSRSNMVKVGLGDSINMYPETQSPTEHSTQLMMRSVSTEKYENLAIGREEHWGVLLPREHPLAERDALDPKELRKTPLILPENTVFRKEVLSWTGGQPDVRATYTLVRNAILLELAGGGHIVCLDMPATSSHGLVFVPFAPTRKSEPVLIWKQNSAVSPAVQVFLDYLDHPEEK